MENITPMDGLLCPKYQILLTGVKRNSLLVLMLFISLK
jgi:hypothetical protein